MAKTDFLEANILLAVMGGRANEAERLIRSMTTTERTFLRDVAEEMLYLLKYIPNPQEVE